MKGIKRKRINKLKKIIKKKSTYYTSVEVLIVMFISMLFGAVIGIIGTYTKYQHLDASDTHVQEVVNTYNDLLSNYYDKVDGKSLANAAINGMINSLEDPNSKYMSEEDGKTFNESVNGYYEGVGIQIALNDNNECEIINVFEGSSADKKGVKTGDIIVSINNTRVGGKSLDEISNLISTNSNKKVALEVRRKDASKKFTLTVGKVEMPSVFTEEYDNDINYIQINNFASNTSEQFLKKYKTLKNTKGLIIDLRNNPGGHLDQVKPILEPFFKKGVVLYQIEVKDKINKITSSSKDNTKYPIVILIDNNTASVAEIVTSCFKDNYKNITIVGTESYGKGTIQREVSLSTGSVLKYTTEKWLTANGQWLDKDTTGGIKPDVVVENNCSNEECKDTQLEKAKEIINKKIKE